MPRIPDPESIQVLDDETVEILRKMTPSERVQLSLDFTAAVRRRMSDRIRNEHPDWTEEQIQRENAARYMRGDIGESIWMDLSALKSKSP